MFKIKQVSYSDEFDEIEAIQKILFPECPNLIGDEGYWWIVYNGKEIAGFCGMIETKDKDAIYLCRAGVFPKFRGKGLHKRMIRVRLKEAKKLGYKIVLSDTTNNPASANNLIDCGFKMFLPEAPWAYSNSCYWYKKI